MLEYENQIFLDILQDDGLVITAKGLGLENVFTNILKAYSDPGQLVLVLGTNDYDETFFIEQLKKQEVKHLPKIITAQCLAEEREITYLEGGVLFISGRILVVDLLKNRVPINLVSGILVYRAHSILTSHQEAFALRLYRQSNKVGFIKAFSNSAVAFNVGFNQVEQVMKRLFVKKLYLWPRFHKIVNNCLLKHKPEVFELHVKLTPKMLNIQSALLDVMNYTVQELKRINKYLDLDELTVENAIAKKFYKQLQLQLDPIWDQLSFKSKQLIADLKTQRSLLMCLTHENSVSFYANLNSLRTMEYAMKSSGWTVLDVVDEMFKCARSRVFKENDELSPEPNPKWTALSEVLNEINEDRLKNSPTNNNVLILSQDSRTCFQLNNYLTMGSKEYLLLQVRNKLKASKIQEIKQDKVSNKKSRTDHPEKSDNNTDNANEDDEEEQKECYFLTLTQSTQVDKSNKSNEAGTSLQESNSENQDAQNFSQLFEHCSGLADFTLPTEEVDKLNLIIQSSKKGGDSMSLQKILDEAKPSYVILYAADISTVRQLEVYQNKNTSISLKVYFLIYGGSVEEQAYLTSLRREKDAFEKLINAKTTMVVSTEQDGKSAETASSSNDILEETGSTRKGGLQQDQSQVKNKIIVDMREFRSELPSLLHQRDIEIEPVTLLIGDYILSPDICIERKSISDLIGSLNSGRLYNQAMAMSRYYTKPMVLIEFDQNKPFGLQGNYYVSRDMKSIEIINKLQLLTLHFPKLKLVWSPSPHATAQLFEELKQGRPQPDALKAAQIGVDLDCDDANVMSEKYNCNIQDLITKLPGIHTKNLRLVLNNGKSLDYLCSLTQDELSQLIGSKVDAETLFKALHEKQKATSEASSSSFVKPFSKVKSRGLFYKKK